MTRLAFVIALMPLAACFASHPSGQQELASKDCYTCHTTDYTTTTAPVHRDTPQVFSTTCANCHRTAGWQPALEGLHSDVFIIAQGPHSPIACLDCHDLASAQPSKLGANTNCIRCHPDDTNQEEVHVGLTSVANVPYAYQASAPNFCLQCHPAGTADKHPDNLFARRGEHAVPCAQCHDRTAGPDTKGANVTCVESRCHHTASDVETHAPEPHSGARYIAAKGDGTSRNFCHQCH